MEQTTVETVSGSTAAFPETLTTAKRWWAPPTGQLL